MINENEKPRKDKKGKVVYETRSHQNDLPDKIFPQPDKKTNSLLT